jgi:signal transduction histidine kinase
MPTALLLLSDAAEARSLAHSLAAQGCAVEHRPPACDAAGAQPGQQGLPQPDLVFIDEAALRQHGGAAGQGLRQRWLAQGVALFVCSPGPREAQARAALGEEAGDWLQLPLDAAGLAARLRPYLELWRLRREVAELQRRARAQHELAELGMLGVRLAHEVSNPNHFVKLSAGNLARDLCRFKAYLDGLLDDGVDPEIRAELARRFERLEQHLGLVDEGSRLIAGVVQATRLHARTGLEAEVDLAEVLERSVRLVQVGFGPTVRFERDLAARAPVRCVAGRMQQVFVNLLVNACHAVESRPGPPDRRECGVVRAVSRRQGVHLLLGVLDNGCGMTAEVQRRLFEPFFTTKDAARGTGLGLGISRDIVRDMGGDIEVRSRPGEGTEMWLWLPVAAEVAR